MRDLRDDFAALREQDRKDAPAFEETARARPRPKGVSPIVYVLPAATMFAAAAAFAIWIATRPQAEPPAARAAAAARAPAPDPEPLGFLLDEPAALARFTDFDKDTR
jgi:hypothetical protein